MINGFNYVAIPVYDLPAMAVWYRDTLALEITEQTRSAVEFRLGASATLALYPGGAASTKAAPEHEEYYVCLEVDALGPLLERLKQQGRRPEHGIEPKGDGRLADIRDPEGHLLGLWEKRRSS